MGLRSELCVEGVELLRGLALALADDPRVLPSLGVEVLASLVARGVLLGWPRGRPTTCTHGRFFSRLDLRRCVSLHCGWLGRSGRLGVMSIILLGLLLS